MEIKLTDYPDLLDTIRKDVAARIPDDGHFNEFICWLYYAVLGKTMWLKLSFSKRFWTDTEKKLLASIFKSERMQTIRMLLKQSGCKETGIVKAEQVEKVVYHVPSKEWAAWRNLDSGVFEEIPALSVECDAEAHGMEA